jgi:putative oxidoreductase
MSYGLLFLRVVVGLIFFAHGSQKLFGWFEGPGLAGVRGWLGGIGFRLPALMALLVSVSEASGLLLALGLITPFAALALTATMFVAIATAHWKNGFWNGKGGFEFNLSLIAAVVCLAATGPGRFSLDHAFGWDDNLSGLWWGVGVLVLGALGAAFVLTVMKKEIAAEAGV